MDNEQRLMTHIKTCHRIIAQLTGIIEGLWEAVQLDHPDVTGTDEGVRLQSLLATIRRATDPSKEN